MPNCLQTMSLVKFDMTCPSLRGRTIVPAASVTGAPAPYPEDGASAAPWLRGADPAPSIPHRNLLSREPQLQQALGRRPSIRAFLSFFSRAPSSQAVCVARSVARVALVAWKLRSLFEGCVCSAVFPALRNAIFCTSICVRGARTTEASPRLWMLESRDLAVRGAGSRFEVLMMCGCGALAQAYRDASRR